jgi:hypothetical protein
MAADLDPFYDTDVVALIRSAAIGVSRSPMALGPSLEALVTRPDREPLLDVVALLGQRLRHDRPSLPAGAGRSVGLPPSDIPILPPKQRTAWNRVMRANERALGREGIAAAALRALAGAGFRVHPFDLAPHAGQLAPFRGLLDPSARAFFARRTGETAVVETPAAEVTADTWHQASKADRLRYIRALRRTDPGRARAVIEQHFSSEPAAARVELLRVMDEDLTAEDRPFLEANQQDRAATVREEISALLARFPDTEAARARLAEARDLLQVTRRGLLSTKRRLEVTPPKVADEKLDQVLRDRFREIPLDALLAAVEVKGSQLADLVLQADRPTAMVLLRAAIVQRDEQAIRTISRAKTALGPVELLFLIQVELGRRPAEIRRRLLLAALDLPGFLAAAALSDLYPLVQALDGPLPEPLADVALSEPVWDIVRARVEAAAAEDQSGGEAFLALFAALMPRSRGSRLLAAFQSLGPAPGPVPLRFAEFLSLMESP